MPERICIFIDGANFYHLTLKKMGLKDADFNYEGFSNFLADGRTITEMGKRFYIGTVREREGDVRSKAAMAEQTSFFSSLTSTKWQLKTSKLRERTEKIVMDGRVQDYEKIRKLGIKEIIFTRNREKGIDVKLVTDLFIGAIDNKYDTAIIVSSDTDLVPAIDSVRYRLKRKVEYIGFSIEDPNDKTNSTKPILSMISRTDRQRTLVESDLKTFVNYRGIIIEESLLDTSLLKRLKITTTKIESVTEKHKTPWVKQWTLHTIVIPEKEAAIIAEELSQSLDHDHNWYADFKTSRDHYIIFRGKVFHVTDRSSKTQYEEATKYGVSIGIPAYQVDFSPHVATWKR
ncbi:MAG: NYN domain-containing protein [bacterium]|nr:NYN domain-containing protein [bacterium]